MATKSKSAPDKAASDRAAAIEKLNEERRQLDLKQAKAANSTRDAIKATNQYQHGATTREEQVLAEAAQGGKAFSGNFQELIPESSGEDRVWNQWEDDVAAKLQEEFGDGPVEPPVEGEAAPLKELAPEADVRPAKVVAVKAEKK